jgi:hypothetical protein
MTRPGAGGAGGRRGLATTALLAGTAVVFALSTDLPWYFAVTLALAGVGGSVALRRADDLAMVEFAAAPALVAVGGIALAAPATPAAALLGGGCALAVLLWLSDDPARTAGGVRRAVPTVLVAGLAFVVAWGSALILPETSGELGLAGGLLALSLVLIAVIVGWPHLLEREPAATA